MSGRVSKVDETAAQIRYPWLWLAQLETCAPEHYHAATADLGSAFPSAFPSLPNADWSACHRSMVQSLLSSVVGNSPAARLVIRENCGHDFPADVECGTSWVAESWRVSTALTLVWCLDPSGESTFHHHTGQHVVRGFTVDSQQLRTCFHPKLLLNGCQKTWGPSETDLA